MMADGSDCRLSLGSYCRFLFDILGAVITMARPWRLLELPPKHTITRVAFASFALRGG